MVIHLVSSLKYVIRRMLMQMLWSRLCKQTHPRKGTLLQARFCLMMRSCLTDLLRSLQQSHIMTIASQVLWCIHLRFCAWCHGYSRLIRTCLRTERIRIRKTVRICIWLVLCCTTLERRWRWTMVFTSRIQLSAIAFLVLIFSISTEQISRVHMTRNGSETCSLSL